MALAFALVLPRLTLFRLFTRCVPPGEERGVVRGASALRASRARAEGRRSRSTRSLLCPPASRTEAGSAARARASIAARTAARASTRASTGAATRATSRAITRARGSSIAGAATGRK